MRLRITKSSALMLITLLVAIATLSSTATAEAHTVTRHDCVQYARHHQPHKVALDNCLNWAAAHNICHGVPHCHGWLLVAICESGNQRETLTVSNIASIRWTIHNSYEGGMQFNSGTWDARHTGYAAGYEAPAPVQMIAAEGLRHAIGGNPHQSAGWPICGAWWH